MKRILIISVILAVVLLVSACNSEGRGSESKVANEFDSGALVEATTQDEAGDITEEQMSKVLENESEQVSEESMIIDDSTVDMAEEPFVPPVEEENTVVEVQVLPTDGMTFTEDYTYWDHYLETLSEEDRQVIFDSYNPLAFKGIRYDGAGNEILYSSLTGEEKLMRVDEAREALETEFINPANDIEAEWFQIQDQIWGNIIELETLEIYLEFGISDMSDEEINDKIIVLHAELEVIYNQEYEFMEEHDMLDD